MQKIDLSTELAVTRTRLASERTLMSWVRTSFSMIGIGFAVMKFSEYLEALKIEQNLTDVTYNHMFIWGRMLIALGLFSLVPGLVEHRNNMKVLAEIDGKGRRTYVFYVALFVALLGFFALLSGHIKNWFPILDQYIAAIQCFNALSQ